MNCVDFLISWVEVAEEIQDLCDIQITSLIIKSLQYRVLHQSVVKWLTIFFSKSNLWSIENKKLKEFHKKYYGSENRAYVLALEVGKQGNLKLESFIPYYNEIQRLKNNV